MKKSGKKKKPYPWSNKKTKLSLEDATYIKSQIEVGASLTWLAKKFGISVPTVHNIKTGKKWAHAPVVEMELEGPKKGQHLTQE